MGPVISTSYAESRSLVLNVVWARAPGKFSDCGSGLGTEDREGNVIFKVDIISLLPLELKGSYIINLPSGG